MTDASVVRDEIGKYKGRAGIMVLDENNNLKNFESKSLGNVTSNEGEYIAMLEGLRDLTTKLGEDEGVDLKDIIIQLYTDSSLVYNQMMNNYKTKKSGFIKLQNEIKKYCKCYKGAKIIWHKRNLDLAMLADFGSKHPRRTKILFERFKDQNFSQVVEKAARFILKDEAAAKKEAKWYIVDQAGNEMFHGKEFASSIAADCYISDYILDDNHDMHHEDEKYYKKIDEFVVKQRKETYE